MMYLRRCSIADGSQLVYAKGYHGEAKTWNVPRDGVIRRAVDDLVNTVGNDEQVTKALTH